MFYCLHPTTQNKEAVANVTKVLIVDDEHMIADALAIILNKAGFNASAVYSGTEAVEVAKSLKPDLIISDVAMPDMNGIEAMILNSGLPSDLQSASLLWSRQHGRSAVRCPGSGA